MLKIGNIEINTNPWTSNTLPYPEVEVEVMIRSLRGKTTDRVKATRIINPDSGKMEWFINNVEFLDESRDIVQKWRYID